MNPEDGEEEVNEDPVPNAEVVLGACCARAPKVVIGWVAKEEKAETFVGAAANEGFAARLK